eukprot:3172136-Prymnesium_polylepis.1
MESWAVAQVEMTEDDAQTTGAEARAGRWSWPARRGNQVQRSRCGRRGTRCANPLTAPRQA